MGRLRKIVAMSVAALITLCVFATDSHAARCRYFVVASGEQKLFCRTRFSGWQPQEQYARGYRQTRQPYGGPDYAHNRWRQHSETPAQAAEDTSGYDAGTGSAQTELAGAIDKLVAVDSQSWIMNSYDSGSVYDAQVERRGADGNATTVFGRYTYNGGSRGWVRVRLSEGKLSCMEFWDFQGTCRSLGHSPSHAIAAVTVAVAAVAVAAAASPSGHRSGGGTATSDGDSQQPYYGPRPDNDSPSQQEEPEQQRTYGLHGDCPQSGAGYGC